MKSHDSFLRSWSRGGYIPPSFWPLCIVTVTLRGCKCLRYRIYNNWRAPRSLFLGVLSWNAMLNKQDVASFSSGEDRRRRQLAVLLLACVRRLCITTPVDVGKRGQGHTRAPRGQLNPDKRDNCWERALKRFSGATNFLQNRSYAY